ncbi:MAG: hypothetical protein ABIX01_13995 [Chitinophagaceae bacterium]
MKAVLYLLFIFMGQKNLVAQAANDHCGTTEQMKLLYEQHPQSLTDAQNFDAFTRQFAENKTPNRLNKTNAPAYTIPVVVHVLASSFNNVSATVTLAKIRTAIVKTNEDFQGLNPEYASIDPQFAAIKQTMDIQFELAQTDPNGNPTTGVIFYPN